MVSMKIKGQ